MSLRPSALVMPLLLSTLLVASCRPRCPACPKPVTPAPVTVIAEPLACNLPALPMPIAKPIGFPSPDGQSIYMSTSDAALLVDYLMSMRGWIEAAAPCLVAP